MPIYEYQCESCSKVTETLRRITEADDAIACEHCASKKTKRMHSVFAAGSGEASMPSLPRGGGCGCGKPHGPCSM